MPSKKWTSADVLRKEHRILDFNPFSLSFGQSVALSIGVANLILLMSSTTSNAVLMDVNLTLEMAKPCLLA
jgi:hypothetical protein